MSLEREIAALTQATNQLTEATLQSMKTAQTALTEAQTHFDDRFIVKPLTLEVGSTRFYSSIQSAWEFLKTKVILAPVLIKIDPGLYLESLRLSHQPYAHWITLCGAGKGQTVIQNLYEEDVWIIFCQNVRGLTLSGMTLRGHYTSTDAKLHKDVTHGLGIDDNSKIHIQAGTLSIEYCWAGLCVYRNSGVIATEIEINHSRHGVVIDGGYANVERAILRGLGRSALEGGGIIAANGGYITAHQAVVSDFVWGFDSERSSMLEASETTAQNCEVGYRSAFSATIFAQGSKAETTYYGYLADFSSTLYTIESQAIACDYAYFSRWNSCVYANDTITTNCKNAYRAELMGYLEAFQTLNKTHNTTTAYSPPQYAVLGNENGMIRWS